MRYVVLLGWLAGGLVAVAYLPSLSASGGIGDLVPKGSAALRAETDATSLFRVPMTAPVAVVQYGVRRLPLPVQEKVAEARSLWTAAGPARFPGWPARCPSPTPKGHSQAHGRSRRP